MQQGNFIDVFLALMNAYITRRTATTHTHTHTHKQTNKQTNIHTHFVLSHSLQCRKPYAATQSLMLLMIGVCTRNMSS